MLDRHPLTPQATLERLCAAGVPVAPTLLADDADSAARAGVALETSPLVLKAGGLLHKSDRGGVIIGITGADALAAAAENLLDSLGTSALPLVVQPQLAGTEVLVGVRREPGVGAVVLVGLGGIHAEVLGDTAVGTVPVTEARARALLEELRGWPLLAGHRGSGGVDVDALCALLTAVSRLAEAQPDVVELDLNPVLVGPVGAKALAVDARVLVAPPPPRRLRGNGPLDRVLHPRHVAVVGVSDDLTKVGARVHTHLERHGFPGRIDAVHPAGGRHRGRSRVRSLDEVRGSPDLVCVAVPAAAVLDVARAAVRKRAGGVLVHSSGFADAGPDGARLQAELAAVLRAGGVRLVGPNSMGIVAPRRQLAASLGGVLARPTLPAGGIALLSSSGALSSCLASRLWERGAGISYWIALGNEADADLAEYLDWLAGDPDTTVVGLVLEQLADGPRTAAAARRLVARGTPVFAYMIGRSPEGQQVAQSHTGALVGSAVLREAVLVDSGVVVTEDLQVLEDALRLAAAGPLPAGRRLGVLTASGGAAAIIADEARAAGLELPPLPPALAATLAGHLPDYASVGNPLDVSLDLMTHPAGFEEVLRACTGAACFDAVVVQLTTNADPTAEVTARAVVATREDAPLPLYISRYGAQDLAPRGTGVLAAAGVPVLDRPEAVIRSVGAIVRASTARRNGHARPTVAGRDRSRTWTSA